MVASLVHPLLHLSRVATSPRALSTFLPRALVGARPCTEERSLLSLSRSLQQRLQPALEFKTKGVIKKRCKDCYYVKRRGRWLILCKTNPRHKQRQM
ncbi:large ribosomal subunit protein bL36m isoform X2 [Castor canadensis]|jgi:large subunit ribosomal protein L36